jgi:hypothetical protein
MAPSFCRKANEKRTLVLTPDFVDYPAEPRLEESVAAPLGPLQHFARCADGGGSKQESNRFAVTIEPTPLDLVECNPVRLKGQRKITIT